MKALRDDIHERDDIAREVILCFEELSRSLYERAGSLTISETPNGPRFEVHSRRNAARELRTCRSSASTHVDGESAADAGVGLDS